MIKHLLFKDRFLSHVFIPENPDGCWEWVGAKNSDGYGRFGINDKLYQTHRVSYALFVGMIPDGMEVCHRCDNPACCNPAHLFLGTHKDNMTDRNNKNRQSHSTKMRGENQGRHKLTEQHIYKIRELIEQGYKNVEIAKMFGVKPNTISNVKTGTQWGWLK